MTPRRPPPRPWRSSTMCSRPWPSTVWGTSRCTSAPTGSLVGYWRIASPKTSWNSAVGSAMRRRGKKGGSPTHTYLDWLQYGWYIPNVGATVWAAEVVATVYRIRWQIELLFKQWKSLLHLHVLKGPRPERIRCLLYGRLITITMLMRVCSYAAWYAAAVCHREVSV